MTFSKLMEGIKIKFIFYRKFELTCNKKGKWDRYIRSTLSLIDGRDINCKHHPFYINKNMPISLIFAINFNLINQAPILFFNKVTSHVDYCINK